jgi:hypothetical protein
LEIVQIHHRETVAKLRGAQRETLAQTVEVVADRAPVLGPIARQTREVRPVARLAAGPEVVHQPAHHRVGLVAAFLGELLDAPSGRGGDFAAVAEGERNRHGADAGQRGKRSQGGRVGARGHGLYCKVKRASRTTGKLPNLPGLRPAPERRNLEQTKPQA